MNASTASPAPRVLIVGGVAGGAACAARLRRVHDDAEIHVFERGPHISFANCGLPYFIGGIITDEADLLLADPALFKSRFDITVHTRTEVLAIDREAKTIRVRDLANGTERDEAYDALVLSPGASPLRPPLPGIDLPGIFTLRNVPDSAAIRTWIADRQARRAVVIGAGFIGLEMAENLRHRGLEVTVIEMADQVMPPLDREMAAMVEEKLEAHGVRLALSEGCASFSSTADGKALITRTTAGREFTSELVILAIGVRPETKLAADAGLELGERGGIHVGEQMRTSDPAIWAVGDAVEVRGWVSGQHSLVPLAGPAARQGRLAADVISGRDVNFRGVQGTAICGLFGTQIASTGASEKVLQRLGETDYAKAYLIPNNHVTYYPGAEPMWLKILFRPSDGRILGAQGVGGTGVDRRIDVISMALQKHGTIFDLEEAELCYAPQFGGAKDALNFAGMVAANHLRGDAPLVHWDTPDPGGGLFLDVRTCEEWDAGHIPGATHIPVDELRQRSGELPCDRQIRVYCGVGARAHTATCLLRQRGFDAHNISGGWKLRRYFSAPAKT